MLQTRKNYFKIGNFVFQVTYPENITPPENFLLFQLSESESHYLNSVDYSYYLIYENFGTLADISELTTRTPVAIRDDLLVYQNNLEARLIRARGNSEYYAFYKELSENEAIVFLNITQSGLLSMDTVFSSLFALERRISTKQGLILHCAYLQYHEKAILFSAPSGVGKSTQASLWEKYKEGVTINGDRALLLCKDHTWMAFGWPVCGSSNICHNITLPVQAIIMLSQGKTNEVSKLSPMQSFTSLYSQITINRWNQQAAAHTMDLMEHLIESVPIYHLSCTISKEAVDLLADKIF